MLCWLNSRNKSPTHGSFDGPCSSSEYWLRGISSSTPSLFFFVEEDRFLFRPFRAGSSDYVFVTFFRAMKLYFWVRPRTRALSKTRSFAAAKSLWKMRRVIRFILAQAPSINDAGVAYRDLRTSAWALSKTCSKRCFTDSILESSFSAVSKLILRILVNIIN